MENNIIPHVDTGLKTHKYLVRYEDAEYYASHRDLKKEYEIRQSRSLKNPGVNFIPFLTAISRASISGTSGDTDLML